MLSPTGWRSGAVIAIAMHCACGGRGRVPPGAAFIHDTAIRKIDAHGVVSIVAEHFEQPMVMTTDRHGQLWVVAAGVLTVYDEHDRRSTNLPGERDDIVAISSAAGGGVWALQHHVLLRIDETLHITSYPAPILKEAVQFRDGKPVYVVREGWHPEAVELDGTLLENGGDVWVASSQGLYRFSTALLRWDRVRVGWFRDLVRDSNGLVWTIDSGPVSKSAYLVGWNGVSTFESELPLGITRLAAGRDGRVFAKSITDGANRPHACVSAFTATRDGRVAWESPMDQPRMSIAGPFVVDGNERIWAQSTDARDIIVVDRSGQPVATLPCGLAYEISVAGGGPDLGE